MSTRLVPYRPLSQVYADGNVTALMASAGAFGARIAFGVGDPAFVELIVSVAIILGALLSIPLADWRARRRRAEMISTDEHYRRTLTERAQRPIWESIGSMALLMAFITTALLLALLDMEAWPIVPPAVAAASVIGAIGGAYLWTYSRNAANSIAQTDLASDGSQGKLKATPFSEIAKRHYTGYAFGLATGLLASTVFVDREIAVGALLVGFFVGKLASDSALPQVFYGTVPTQSLKQFLYGIVFAVLWWGVPFGILLAAATHIMAPIAKIDSYVVPFLATSLGSIVFFVSVTIILFLSKGRPEK